jgi:hypothetical protein
MGKPVAVMNKIDKSHGKSEFIMGILVLYNVIRYKYHS